MFIALSRPRLALAGTADPVIEAVVNLMPDYSAGRRQHALYVNKLRSALPGNRSQVFGTGPSFRSVFFRDWQPDPLLAMTDDTGLSAQWWSNFSAVVLCQAITDLGSDIRGQMLSGKIDDEVASYNRTLRARSSRVYAKVLAATYEPLIALLRQVNRDTARRQFHDALLDNVLSRQLWYQAGQWTSPDWEMFNQYAKYLALGASDVEMDTLIGELLAAGLPIPGSVDRQGWRSYSEQLRDKPTVDLADIRTECAGPVTETTSIPTTGPGGSARMPDGNSYEFTANGRPGARYRRPPGGSCFTGGTQVLDGAGRAVPLRLVKRGDTVLTRDGTATVAYVAQPLRGERPLYRLTGGGPVFAGTHPFLNAAPGDDVPKVLAVQPDALAWDVPTLGETGIGPLEPGSLVLSRGAGEAKPPVTTAVTGVEEVTRIEDETYLYDVRLAAETGTRQEFWAGDGDRFHLVAPEYPVLDEAGPAAATVVAVMAGLLASGGPEQAGWPAWITARVHESGAGIFRDALTEALTTTPSFGAPAPPGPVHDRIDRLYHEVSDAPAETASVVAGLFDGLLASAGQWLASVVTLGWRTSSSPGDEVIAVTVFDAALTPVSPVPAGTAVRLDVTATGHDSSDGTCLWDRRGRANTAFHRYFDQIVHLDAAGSGDPADLSFAITADGGTTPLLSAMVPGVLCETAPALRSASLRDPFGTVVGAIRFDTRLLDRDTAARELGAGGLWTGEAARAYADALGGAMVEPILSRLRRLGPTAEQHHDETRGPAGEVDS
ncbi:hypothetical protein [Amycolatopsis sp. WQ 127309]|uniref:hypothetical protein n=1 Tax=Amycolatopsis sp. WQ 127309 TaxID=2932773 RepID=UPI001FF310FE|nr:hypothetical protein [Amycolatopsis sp. WQ 127309]UOZ10657.1 hypothetical protein MUY22_21295 [Amycolatopsis sp. WQ 127309]